MKKLFMIIFVPILVVLGTPALVATLMYDGTGDEHMPTYLYTDEYDFEEMLFTELNTSMDEVVNGASEDFVFNLHSDIINRAIYEAILESNPDYAPGDDCVTDQECYIAAQPVAAEGFELSFRVVGMWVSFYDGASAADPGRFTFNVFLEVDLDSGVQYKTVVEVHFLFEDDADYYYLEFDKVQVGRIPLPKSIFTSAIGVAEDQADMDLEEQLGDLPLGELDLDNLSYTIEKDDILAAMIEDEDGEVDSGALLAQQLLSIVFDNQLINFDLVDDEFTITAGVSKFRTEEDVDIPEYLYDLHDVTIEEGEEVIGDFNPELFDPNEYLQNVFTEFIFNNALLGGGFEISEETFNKLIYANAEGFTDTQEVVEIEASDLETTDVEIGLQAIWFEFEEDGIYVKALFKIAGIDSVLTLRAEETSTAVDELIFEFSEINAGKDAEENPGDYLEIDDMTAFQAVFAELGDVEFGTFDENGNLIISAEQLSALMQEGSEAGAVVVTEIDLIEEAIVLTVEPADPSFQTALDTFQGAVEDVLSDPDFITDLGTVLDTTDETEGAVLDAVEDIQATLLDPETDVDPEQIEELFTNFDDLDTETQEEFIETLINNVDPSVYDDFADIFGGLLDEEDIPTE